MSISSHIRAPSLACCVAGVAVFGALVFAPAAGAFKLGGTYLALGDSLAYGYHQAQFKEEEKNGTLNPASFNDGYADDFGKLLKLADPSLQVINDGCPGETTESFSNGSAILGDKPGFCAGGLTGTPFPYSLLHHPYATTSQLSDALAILAANPNVSPITLDIGSNDVLQFLAFKCGFPAKNTCTEAEIGAEFVKIATNVETILAELHAAAPGAQIILIGAYNPFPTVVAGGDKSQAGLNALLAGAAAKVPGASFADTLPVFNPSGPSGGPESGDIPTICAFTAMCPGGAFTPASPQADIHPTKLGYAVMAAVVGNDFLTH